MTQSAGKSPHLRRVLRWLIPLGISLGAIWLVLRNIRVNEIIENLSQLSFRVFLLATLAYLISYAFRALSWYFLLRRRVPYKDVFFTMGAGYLLNNLFPFRLGEIGRAVLLDDPQGPSALEVLSSVLVERVFDVFLAAVFILTMLPRLLGVNFDQRLILLGLVLTLLGLVILYLAARYQQRIVDWFTRWGEKNHFISYWFTPKITKILTGLSVLNDPGAFLLAFGSLFLSWMIAFGENYIVFRSLYPNPPFWWMVFVLSAGAFGAALPSAPAGLGVFEGVMVAAFGLLGVASDLAFTHAIVIHVLAFVYANLFGLIGLRLRGEAAVSLFRRVIKRPPDSKAAE